MPIDYPYDEETMVQFIPATLGDLSELRVRAKEIDNLEADEKEDANDKLCAWVISRFYTKPKFTEQEVLDCMISTKMRELFDIWNLVSRYGKTLIEEADESIKFR
jgi:hypothetical protein